MRGVPPAANGPEGNNAHDAPARVGDEATVATRVHAASATKPLARLGDRLASPIWLAVSVFVLAAFVGVVSTFSSYRALRRSGELRADASLRQRASQLRGALNSAFGAADPLLAELGARVVKHEPGQSFEPIWERMRLLATARQGLTWISASFPDGTFAGLFLDEHGRLTAQDSSVGTPHGVERRYEFDEARRVRLRTEEPSDYDPRARGFYELAVATRGRAWTAPYTFYRNLRTGISRVEPLYTRDARGVNELVAVLTVDFDATELAKLLDGRVVAHERLLVLSDDGSVLASAGTRRVRASELAQDRPQRASDLHDPVLTRAVRTTRAPHGRGAGAGAGTSGRHVVIGSTAYRIDRVPLVELDGHGISLFSLVPENELYAAARREAASGVIATATTALVGLGFAFALAASIARLRRKREQAEREVVRVQAEIAELGSYELVTRLGVGGMGEVWRARHKLLARDAALKLIRSDEGESGVAVRNTRFFDEAKLLASMRSLHTVAVYDFGVANDGRYFLAMELLEGLDLDALVRSHGVQPAARVASILAQICDSLREAHDAGLVHQDIKPANVFLCRLAESLDVVKVLDFGLTRAVGKRRNDGRTVEGTPAFMAPEQATGGAVGPAADLYAVGCVGYWLLTGRFPYEADSSEAFMQAHVSAPVPELPPGVLARIPSSLAMLLTRCLAKKPDRRPTSAASLAKALRQSEAECLATYTQDERAAFWATRAARASAANDPAMVAATVEDMRVTVRLPR